MTRFAVLMAALLAVAWTPGPLAAQSSPAAAMMRLLKSGRVPEDRIPTLLELVGSRGTSEDLAYIYQQCLADDGYQGDVRLKALDVLANAAENRQVKPEADLAGLSALIAPAAGKPTDARTQLAAIRLAGVWKVDALSDSLSSLADSDNRAVRQAAIDALVAINSEASRSALEKLTAANQRLAVRYRGAAALATLDPKATAKLAAELLAAGTAEVDPAPLIDAFLNHQGGSDLLAAALAGKQLPEEAAKLALRHMYAVGRSDGPLAKILGEAAGVGEEPPPPTNEEIRQLVAEVIQNGDPARGEMIFRRDDLSCMKCHAVSKAGGEVGPDLSPVGATSPPDYLIKSILLPNEAVKEAFLTHIVITDEGKIYQGIITDRNDERIILKEATGEQRSIPTASIDEMTEGPSLMPKGLTRFLTRAELVDLVRFLSELGKPGPYGIRTAATMQRWRAMAPQDERLTTDVPDSETFSERVLSAPEGQWFPVYAKVAGGLPLDEVAARLKGDVLYLRGEFDVTAAGNVGFEVEHDGPFAIWVDDEPFGSQAQFDTAMEPGRHSVTLRVKAASQPGSQAAKELRLTLVKPSGSQAQFTVVDGR